MQKLQFCISETQFSNATIIPARSNPWSIVRQYRYFKNDLLLLRVSRRKHSSICNRFAVKLRSCSVDKHGH